MTRRRAHGTGCEEPGRGGSPTGPAAGPRTAPPGIPPTTRRSGIGRLTVEPPAAGCHVARSPSGERWAEIRSCPVRVLHPPPSFSCSSSKRELQKQRQVLCTVWMGDVVAGRAVRRPGDRASGPSRDGRGGPWMAGVLARLSDAHPRPGGELSTVLGASVHGLRPDNPQSCPQMWVKRGRASTLCDRSASSRQPGGDGRHPQKSRPAHVPQRNVSGAVTLGARRWAGRAPNAHYRTTSGECGSDTRAIPISTGWRSRPGGVGGAGAEVDLRGGHSACCGEALRRLLGPVRDEPCGCGWSGAGGDGARSGGSGHRVVSGAPEAGDGWGQLGITAARTPSRAGSRGAASREKWGRESGGAGARVGRAWRR